ncbi:polysaccharide biosynthesis protein [Bacillus shivajii]|uniref:putative polysaccharide biosynthesis protein n=1 Tax=Bacillus shivajii TaxID=1983719 RepID=UPI001CFB634C|nr:polysaccharide biosynthesis protein [Bacillus shivajii]UCZ51443.1 polysaccharide biosynthesis protein [Bacillus shivajii]
MQRKSFIHSALLLTVATFISKILGSFFRVPLQNIAGNEVLGIYTLVYPVYMAVLALSVAGIPLALSKLISDARHNGQEHQIQEIFKTASILAIVFGFSSFFFVVINANFISDYIGGQHTQLPLVIVSASLLIAPYMAIYRGFFQGFENMQPTAISQIIEQFVRVGVILIAAIFLAGQGANSNIIASGVMAGSFISVIAAVIYLRVLFARTNFLPKTNRYSFSLFVIWSKRIIKIAIPFCVGTLTLTLIFFIDSVTVPNQLLSYGYKREHITELYGIYGRGLILVQIPVVFAQALVLPLIPAISSGKSKTNNLIDKSMNYIHLISWPLSIGLFALTVPLNYAFFGDFQESHVLALTHISALLMTFSVLTTGIMQGIDRSYHAALTLIGLTLLKVFTNSYFIEQFGLLGLPASTMVIFSALTVINFYFIYRTTKIQIWKRKYTIFAASSILMGLSISAPLLFFKINEWSRIDALVYVFCTFVIGVMIYGLFLFLWKAVSTKDLTKIPLIKKHIPFS